MPAEIPWDRMFELAHAARAQAHAPYSNFKVGATGLFEDGSLISGCNVENASYGLAVCAERNAIGAAVAQGKKRLLAIAIVADSAKPCPPCGMCRQVMAEFAAPSIRVRARNLQGEQTDHALEELLPHAFTQRFL